MTTTTRATLMVLCIAPMTSALLAQAPMPQTTKQEINGPASVTTEKLHGTVVYNEGNTLVVRMTGGEIREFDVPESRKFLVDGRELGVRDLQPGTRLTATVTKTVTPVTERTTTVGTGKVWWVSGQSVILTLPNNENRMYKVDDSYRFMVDGRKATVHDLRKGMVISAQKIVEAPKTVLASNIAVVGHAPPPKTESARATPPPPAPAPVRAAPAPAPVETAQAAPEPAPVEQAEAQPATALPSTGSPLFLIGLLGLAFTIASVGLRRLRSH